VYSGIYGNSQNASLAEVATVTVNLQRELPTECILPVSPLKQDQPAPERPVQCLCRMSGFPRWHCVGPARTDRLTDIGEDPSRLQSTEWSSGQNLWSGSLLKTLSSVTETLAGFCVWIHHWRRVIVLVGGCLLIIDWQRLSMYELATCRRLEAGYWEVTGISRWSSWIYRRFVYFWSSPMWRLLRWAVSPSAMIGRCEE